MSSPNKSIRDFCEGNRWGVCPTTAEIVANYAHAPDADASGLTLTQTCVYFIQRSLCKVAPKLSTDLLALAGYKPSYPQAAVDNPRKNPVDNALPAFPPAVGGGWGPAGKSNGHGTPAHIFYFLFFAKSINIAPCLSTATP